MQYRPSPESKAQALVDRLSRATADLGPSELVLRRLEQDARGIMNADPAGAHIVLGGVASLRWDLNGIHDHYRVALQHRDTAETYYNYSVALANVEQRAVAYENGATAHARRPDDRFLLENVIGLAMDGGYFTEGLALCERWRALVPDEIHGLAPALERLAFAVNVPLFRQTAVQHVLAILADVQCEARIRSMSSIAREDPTEPGSFLYEQRVDATPDEAGHLNACFVGHLVAHPELVNDPGMHFVPMFVGMRI